MSKADDLAERAKRQANRSSEPAATTPRAKAKPVRITLDLAPSLHRALTGWCAEAASTLDVPRVPAAAAVRALLQELLDANGNDLEQAVLARLPQELDR